MRLPVILFLLFVTIGGGCRKPRPTGGTSSKTSADSPLAAVPGQWFEDVTEKSGLHFTHDTGPVGDYALPQIMGSGSALFDYDNDGRLDIYLVQNAGPKGAKNQLFHQQPNGTFRDVSAGSGLDVAGYGMGVAIGDINNDGLPDVLLCEYGGVRLFINNGNGTFTEITREAGLAEPAGDSAIRPWPTAATFFDYDRDGRLDLAVASYVAYDPSRSCSDASSRGDYCGPADFPGSITRLYHNEGTDPISHLPHFKDVTAAAGLAGSPSQGLGIFAGDFDDDGWPDFLVANDGRPNHLWINRHDGTFVEQAAGRGVAYNAAGLTEANMGIAFGDTRGVGLFDLFITHLTDENNRLWLQNRPGVFADRTAGAGLIGHGQGTGFGAVLADFDCDGALDLAVVNGRVLRASGSASKETPADLPPYWRPYAERNQLFAGDGRAHFRDLSADNPALCGVPAVYRSLAYGDIFNDGAVSLLATSVAGPAKLFRNVAPHRGHWLLVRAIDPALGGRDAYGARVAIQAGGRLFVGWVNPGSSYLCSNDPRVHFGLGMVDKIDAIAVVWPDGTKETFPSGSANQFRTLSKGSGRTVN